MSDFLPIGLGRDGFDNVSHFKEITTSDSIPEQYLQISNTVAKWNASALQDIPVCTNDPSSGQVLVYNGSEWCPSTLAAGGGGGGGSGGVSGTGTVGRLPSWDSVQTIGNWEPTIPDGNILRWDSTTFLPEDSGLKPTDSGWNANKIQGVSACPDVPLNGQMFVYNSSIGAWCPSTVIIGGGTIDGTGTTGRIVKWSDSDTIGNWEPTITNGRILSWDSTNYVPVDSGYSRTDAGWNADKIQGVSACPTTPSGGQVLVYNSSINAWCPSTLIDNVGVTGTGVTNNIVKWNGVNSISDAGFDISLPASDRLLKMTDANTIGDAGFKVTPPTTDGRILKWNNSTGTIQDSGYTPSDAAWNASGINSVSATVPTAADNNKLFTYSSSLGQYIWTDKILRAESVNIIGQQEGTGNTTNLVVGTSAGGSYIVSGLSTGVFLVVSGNSVVPAFLPDSLLRFYGSINGSFPTKAPPAEIAKNGGEILYYDITNERYTNTGNVKVVGANNLQATNVSATGNLVATGTITASNISTSATADYVPKAKPSGKIDYTWLEEASIDDFAKAGTTNYTAWYAAGLMTGVTLTTFTMTANRLYAMPLVSPRRGSTISDIEIYVTTGAVSTSAIMGLYTNGGEADLYPNTLVASASAELDTTTNSQKRTWNIEYTLNPGQLYWLAVVSNGAPVIRGLSTNQAHYILGTASSANTTWTTHLYATHTYNSSLPSTFPTAGATAGTGAAPGLFYDFSA